MNAMPGMRNSALRALPLRRPPSRGGLRDRCAFCAAVRLPVIPVAVIRVPEAHKRAAVIAVNSSVTVIAVPIARNLLSGLCAACPRTVLVRASPAACGRVHLRVALLRECERGGSKRYSDRKAQSFQGGHVRVSFRKQLNAKHRRKSWVSRTIIKRRALSSIRDRRNSNALAFDPKSAAAKGVGFSISFWNRSRRGLVGDRAIGGTAAVFLLGTAGVAMAQDRHVGPGASGTFPGHEMQENGSRRGYQALPVMLRDNREVRWIMTAILIRAPT